MTEYITCRELIGFIADFLDGSLPNSQRREFARHLEVCPPCVQYVDSYRKTIELGRKALRPRDDEAPEGVPEALIRAILAARKA